MLAPNGTGTRRLLLARLLRGHPAPRGVYRRPPLQLLALAADDGLGPL